MIQPLRHQPDPTTDLVLERTVAVPPEFIFAGWTQPKIITKWFTPVPWKTIDAEVDLRPGGIFRTVMQSPEGQTMDNAGCILEVVENRRFTWTGALKPGFRPRTDEEIAAAPFLFSAVIMMSQGAGTKYTALAIHPDRKSRELHDKMGFHTGWGAALDQLVALYGKI